MADQPSMRVLRALKRLDREIDRKIQARIDAPPPHRGWSLHGQFDYCYQSWRAIRDSARAARFRNRTHAEALRLVLTCLRNYVYLLPPQHPAIVRATFYQLRRLLRSALSGKPHGKARSSTA